MKNREELLSDLTDKLEEIKNLEKEAKEIKQEIIQLCPFSVGDKVIVTQAYDKKEYPVICFIGNVYVPEGFPVFRAYRFDGYLYNFRKQTKTGKPHVSASEYIDGKIVSIKKLN